MKRFNKKKVFEEIFNPYECFLKEGTETFYFKNGKNEIYKVIHRWSSEVPKTDAWAVFSLNDKLVDQELSNRLIKNVKDLKKNVT